VALICIFATVYGYYAWTKLAVEAYPDIADVMTQVSTQAPGLAAEEVEQQVTTARRELNGTPGLLIMRSKSTFGLSLIRLVFATASKSIGRAKRVLERLQMWNCRQGLRRPRSGHLATGQLYNYTPSKNRPRRVCGSSSELQRWVIIPALKQVPGVRRDQLVASPRNSSSSSIRNSWCGFNLSLKNVTDAINANSASAAQRL